MKPFYVKLNDPEDPEKPQRFIFEHNYFDETYTFIDMLTGTTVIMTMQFLEAQDRLPNETDTQFLIRLVEKILKDSFIKSLPPSVRLLNKGEIS